MAKHRKLDKDEVKAPDTFITFSEIVFKYVEAHFKTFVTIVGVVVIIAVGYEGMNFFNSMKEQKATDALYAPENELRKAEADFQEKQNPAGTEDKKAEKAPAAADYTKDYAPIVGKIKAAIKDHPNTKSAVISALNLSYFLSQQKQYQEAQAVLDLPTYHPGNSELLNGFFQMHRGVTYMENNQVDQAINAYQTVLNTNELKVFHPEALLKLGVAYEVKGDAQKAREAYERVGKEFPETEASSTAQQYIRLLELKSTKKG